MKKYFFWLVVFLFAVSYCKCAASEKKAMDTDLKNTFKDDDNKKSMEVDFTNTFEKKDDNSEKKEAEVNVRDVLKKNPEEVSKLETQLQEVKTLLEEAQKYNNKNISEPLEQLVNSIKALQLYHDSKEVDDKTLNTAYKNFTSMKTTLQRVKAQLKLARLNTPEAQKIRRFKTTARNYLRKANSAMRLGHKAEAKYYKTSAQIKQKMALEYAKNPGIETEGAEEIRKAKIKYYEEVSLESAERFRNRAKFMRSQNDSEKAEYCEKVADLKEKLAKAYAQEDAPLVKSLNEQYRKLREENKEN